MVGADSISAQILQKLIGQKGQKWILPLRGQRQRKQNRTNVESLRSVILKNAFAVDYIESDFK